MSEPQLKALASRDNAFVKRLHALAHSARDRRKLDETVLDGAHLVESALAAGVALRALVVSESGSRRAANCSPDWRATRVCAWQLPCARTPTRSTSSTCAARWPGFSGRKGRDFPRPCWRAPTAA